MKRRAGKDRGRRYLDAVEDYNLHSSWTIDPRKACLLVIDMQNHFVHPKGGSYIGDAIVPDVRRLAEGCRRAGVPVVLTRHGHKEDGSDLGMLGRWWGEAIVQGSWDSEVIEGLGPEEGDIVVGKNRYSAFRGTDLEGFLRDKGIEDVIVSGVLTNMCCETTARDAFIRDFRVFFVADATATSSEEMHLASLKNLAYAFAVVKSVDLVLDEVGGGPGQDPNP